jgi:hypothetical protein
MEKNDRKGHADQFIELHRRRWHVNTANIIDNGKQMNEVI